MDIMYKHAQLKTAIKILTALENHSIELNFEEAEDLLHKIKLATKATQKALKDTEDKLQMLDDACDFILAEFKNFDGDVFEITDLIGVAETIKHQMPEL